MKRYRKQTKIAIAVALATTFFGNTIPALSAKEGQIQENNIDKKDKTSEVENLPEIEEASKIEKLPTVEAEEQTKVDSEIKDVVEENSSIEKTGEEIILNEQYFPDAGFREFIKREYAINDNEVLTEEKRNQVTSINVNGAKNNPRTDIKSLEGIQYFPNLERLYCYYQVELTGTLNLSENTKLKDIQAWNTKLTGLNVDGLTNLTHFEVSQNPNLVGDFNLSRNTGLEIVRTSNTSISSLNINGLTNLTNVDISKCPQLKGDFDLSKNTRLELIYADNTKMNTLNINGLTNLTAVAIQDNPNLVGDFDLSGNERLEVIYVRNTAITSLNINGLTNLTIIDISGCPQLKGNFDLSKNTRLEFVYAYNTKINTLNINGLTNLKTLLIQDNPNLVGEFDFTRNTELEALNANNTNINSINVKGLHNLTQFGIANTLIPSLDVSTNTSLQLLDASTNLTWLNIGNNPNLVMLAKKDSIIDLGQLGDNFNITTVTEAFKGIDPSKVTMVSGATYDPATGEVSGYQNGTPIVYSYDSGTMQNGEAATLTVTLNFTKGLSTIRINNYEGKVYDGVAVSNPADVTTTGSNGKVTFEWFRKDENGQWVSLGEQAPVNAGSYGVKAHLASNQNYAAADSGEPTPFEITKATSTVEIFDDLNKTYDKEAVKEPIIKVEGSSGATMIEWYQKDINGVWELLTSAPKEVGEYKVVVKVEEDENYLSAEVEQTFAISEKIEVPSTPEEGEDTTTTEEEKVEEVQTGDVSQTSMWTMLVGLSMSMMYFFRRKKNK